MESHKDQATGVATHTIDAVVAIIIMIMGATVIYGSRKLGSEWTTDGPGAGYFPLGLRKQTCVQHMLTS